jgi:hypothetical protein
MRVAVGRNKKSDTSGILSILSILSILYYWFICCFQIRIKWIIYNLSTVNTSVSIAGYPFVHTCNHRLKCNTYFRFSYILPQHVSSSFGQYQVYTLQLKLLHCYLSMPLMNALFWILKSLIVSKIPNSVADYLILRHKYFIPHILPSQFSSLKRRSINEEWMNKLSFSKLLGFWTTFVDPYPKK